MIDLLLPATDAAVGVQLAVVIVAGKRVGAVFIPAASGANDERGRAPASP
jgi:hypothetical protein